EWYKNRLNNQKTSLIFDNYRSEVFNVTGGIDQGCPLSLLGFIFYNSDVLGIANPHPRKGELSLGF
ncbi:uncharacterized protein HD556DRAFT_1232117, partial [Suillus plorans]